MDTFSNRLKRLRKENGYTQKELAPKIGVSRSALASWEIGRREPDYDTAVRIASIFGLSVDWLLGNDPTPPNNRAHQNPSSEVSAEEMIWIKKRRKLSEQRRRIADTLIDQLGNEDDQAATKI